MDSDVTDLKVVEVEKPLNNHIKEETNHVSRLHKRFVPSNPAYNMATGKTEVKNLVKIKQSCISCGNRF